MWTIQCGLTTRVDGTVWAQHTCGYSVDSAHVWMIQCGLSTRVDGTVWTQHACGYSVDSARVWRQCGLSTHVDDTVWTQHTCGWYRVDSEHMSSSENNFVKLVLFNPMDSMWVHGIELGSSVLSSKCLYSLDCYANPRVSFCRR